MNDVSAATAERGSEVVGMAPASDAATPSAAKQLDDLSAQLDARDAVLHKLFEVAAAVGSSSRASEVLDVITAAYEELLDTTHVSVNLVGYPDPTHERTLAVRGVEWFASHPDGMSSVSETEVERIRLAWAEEPDTIVYPDTSGQDIVDPASVPPQIRSLVVFPVVGTEHALGAVLAGFDRVGGTGSDGLATGRALADLCAAAITRATMHEDLMARLSELEALQRLSGVVARSATLPAALSQLNRLLPPRLDASFDTVTVTGRRRAELVGAQPPTREELTTIRRWRSAVSNRHPLRPVPVDGGVMVPMARKRAVLGAITVRASRPLDDPWTEKLLLALAGGCADVVHRTATDDRLAESNRRLAIAEERERIATDLHDSVGHVITAIGLRLREWLPEAPDGRWSQRLSSLMQLADSGSRDLRGAIYALLFLESDGQNLRGSLRELAERFSATTGVDLSLELEATDHDRGAGAGVLFRVAHEALMNIERHARASEATIDLRAEPNGSVLAVRDDGVGLAHRDPFATSTHHFGLRAAQRRVEAAGGHLEVTNTEPRGVRVKASLPSPANSQQSARR